MAGRASSERAEREQVAAELKKGLNCRNNAELAARLGYKSHSSRHQDADEVEPVGRNDDDNDDDDDEEDGDAGDDDDDDDDDEDEDEGDSGEDFDFEIRIRPARSKDEEGEQEQIAKGEESIDFFRNIPCGVTPEPTLYTDDDEWIQDAFLHRDTILLHFRSRSFLEAQSSLVEAFQQYDYPQPHLSFDLNIGGREKEVTGNDVFFALRRRRNAILVANHFTKNTQRTAVKSVGRHLESLGFNVHYFFEISKSEWKEALKQLRNDSLNFFFFFGHGRIFEGEQVLQMHDKTGNALVSVFSLWEAFKSTIGLNVAVFYTCRPHTPTGRGSRRRSFTVPPGNTIIVNGTQDGNFAYDENFEAFCNSLIDGLRRGRSVWSAFNTLPGFTDHTPTTTHHCNRDEYDLKLIAPLDD